MNSLKKTCNSDACENGCGSTMALGKQIKNRGVEGVYLMVKELNPGQRADLVDRNSVMPVSGQQWYTPAENLTSI